MEADPKGIAKIYGGSSGGAKKPSRKIRRPHNRKVKADPDDSRPTKPNISVIEKGANPKPPLQPLSNPSLRRGTIEKRYSRILAGKLQQLGKLLEQNAIAAGDEDVFMRYMFEGQAEGKDKKVKRSSSFRGEPIAGLNDNNTESDISPEKIEYESNRHTSGKAKRLSHIETTVENSAEDDDIKKLDRLSLLNMGARYELLNANKMMLDLDLELVYPCGFVWDRLEQNMVEHA